LKRVTITTKKSKHANKFGALILSDGTIFTGMGFGYSTVFLEKLSSIQVW
jgi:carbamoyl-phosphate synthase small subunit